MVVLKMSSLVTSPCGASVSARNWGNYLPLSKDVGEKVIAERCWINVSNYASPGKSRFFPTDHTVI